MNKRVRKSDLQQIMEESVSRAVARIAGRNARLDEDKLKRCVRDVINEELENEGWLSNVGNAIGNGISTAYQKGGGLKNAWNAGKRQFNNLQNFDKGIDQYNKGYNAYNKLAQQRDKLQAQIDNLQNQLQKVYTEMGAASRAMGRDSKTVGKENYQQYKDAARNGMNANQYDRTQRQRATA